MNTRVTTKQFNSALSSTRNQHQRYEILARACIEQMSGDGNNTDYLSFCLAAMANKDNTKLLAEGKRFADYVRAHYPVLRVKKADKPQKTSRGSFCPVTISYGKGPRNIAIDPDGNEYDASAEAVTVTDWRSWKKDTSGSKAPQKLTAKAILKLAERADNGIGDKDAADSLLEALEVLRLSIAEAVLSDDSSKNAAPNALEGSNGTANGREFSNPESLAA